MNYIFNIYSLKTLQASFVQEQTGKDIPFICVGSDRNYSDLIWNSVNSLDYSFVSMSAPGSIDVIGFERKSPRLGRIVSYREIESGDIIFAYENNELVYVGEILESDYIYSNSGKMLNIKFDTLLSQFTRQSTIQSNEDVTTLIPTGVTLNNTDFVFNLAKMGELLGFLMLESVFELASQVKIFNPPYYGTPELLNADTEVPYIPSTQSTKEAILLNSTFFYQVLIYQNPLGNVIIDTPSANNISTFDIKDGDIDLITYKHSRREALCPNNVVYSIVYYGFFPVLSDSTQDFNVTVQAIPSADHFPRLNFLFKSKYMAQVELIAQNISGSIISDPTLLEIGQNNYNNPGIYTKVPPNSKNVPSTLNLPASRYLATAITNSRQVVVQLQRNNRTKEIPIGKVFYLNSEPWFCTNASISCTGNGLNVTNTLTLIGVPLYSITGHWK